MVKYALKQYAAMFVIYQVVVKDECTVSEIVYSVSLYTMSLKWTCDVTLGNLLRGLTDLP